MSRILTATVLVACLSGCGGGLPDEVSRNGYQGTWQRGNERVQSTFSIVRVGEEYRFRWGVTSDDGKWRVRCNWEGVCEEFVDGEKTSDYRFRTWVDEPTGYLRVRCDGKVHRPDPLEVHYVNELILDTTGLQLRAQTIEDVSSTVDPARPPRRDYRKVSDYVRDPPEGWVPPGR